jgi:amino acid permease
MFLLNNTFIQGFHCLVGSKYLQTMIGRDAGVCTIGLSAAVAVISWVCSMPRTFNTLSKLAALSAFFTFISVVLAAIFAGIEDHPGGAAGSEWPSLGAPTVYAVPAAGTTFVAGVNAFMNISYTFIGQITIPSFIAEMKEPKDFPKALWAVTIAEVVLFSLVGSIVYAYTGTSPRKHSENIAND